MPPVYLNMLFFLSLIRGMCLKRCKPVYLNFNIKTQSSAGKVRPFALYSWCMKSPLTGLLGWADH